MTKGAAVTVRDARPDDGAVLARIWNSWYSRTALVRATTGTGLIYLVAEVDGEPVGQACVDTLAIPDTGYIYAVAVLESWRSRGIGGTLLEAAHARARDHGFASVTLKVEHSNPRARALYERSGYAVIGDGFDEWDERSEGGEILRHIRVATWLMRKQLV